VVEKILSQPGAAHLAVGTLWGFLITLLLVTRAFVFGLIAIASSRTGVVRFGDDFGDKDLVILLRKRPSREGTLAGSDTGRLEVSLRFCCT
jgi:hypothetical protein